MLFYTLSKIDPNIEGGTVGKQRQLLRLLENDGRDRWDAHVIHKEMVSRFGVGGPSLNVEWGTNNEWGVPIEADLFRMITDISGLEEGDSAVGFRMLIQKAGTFYRTESAELAVLIDGGDFALTPPAAVRPAKPLARISDFNGFGGGEWVRDSPGAVG